MSDRIQELFCSIAPKYDLMNSLLSFGIDRIWRRKAVSFLLEKRHILDLCAGTLALSRELLTQNPQAQVVATDFSREMLEAGLKQLPTAFQHRLQIECVDFFNFTRPPGSFDGAMCSFGMRNLDENELALQRIYQLLGSKGVVVILEFFKPDSRWMQFFHRTYVCWVIPSLGRLISRHPHAYEHLRDSIRSFYTLDQYRTLLQKTGFRVLTSQRLTGGIAGLLVAEKS